MKKRDLSSNPWERKTVAQTIEMYREWSGNYDADLQASGYVSPMRCAEALAKFVPLDATILDFGCGTGLSGIALQQAGFTVFDGIDITPEMLALARQKQIYRKLIQGDPEHLSIGDQPYQGIIAAGVISRGAAPAQTLHDVLALMPKATVIALSYNDPTLDDPEYISMLQSVQDLGLAECLFREHGPHIPSKQMGSDVIVLRRL